MHTLGDEGMTRRGQVPQVTGELSGQVPTGDAPEDRPPTERDIVLCGIIGIAGGALPSGAEQERGQITTAALGDEAAGHGQCTTPAGDRTGAGEDDVAGGCWRLWGQQRIRS
jgi:hypothetical protein